MKPNHSKKSTIIWADDDPDDIYLVHQVLKETGQSYDIVVVSNGKEVLDYLSRVNPEEYPCLIILDINMPVLDGKQTLASLKKHPQFQDISVVVFTTSNSPTDRLFCRHYGAEFFTKPSSFTALRSSVVDLLRHCAPSNNN